MVKLFNYLSSLFNGSKSIIGIGDIHGTSTWKKIIEHEAYDFVVFMGDYFDKDDKISMKEQLENFNALIALKHKHPNKVILLIGNKDYHYFPWCQERYSDYCEEHAGYIQFLFMEGFKARIWQIGVFFDKFLFTHAGVTNTWAQITFNKTKFNNKEFIEALNNLLYTESIHLNFSIGDNLSPDGDDITQGPLWVRPDSLWKDRVLGITHIVGHTPVNQMTRIENEVILIDTQRTSGEYLIIKDGLVEFKSLPK